MPRKFCCMSNPSIERLKSSSTIFSSNKVSWRKEWLTHLKKLTDPFDESKCRPDPDGRTNVNEAVDMFTALGDAVFHWLTMPIGITVIGCKILSVLALQGWRCGDPNQP